MQQIILGILAGFAVDVVEAGEKYNAWLRGDHLIRGAADHEPPSAPIVLVCNARAFLDDLDTYALGLPSAWW